MKLFIYYFILLEIGHFIVLLISLEFYFSSIKLFKFVCTLSRVINFIFCLYDSIQFENGK